MKLFFRKPFFFFIVFIISGYALFEYHRDSKEKIVNHEKSILIKELLKDVTSINLVNNKGDLLLSRNTTGEWELLKPFKDEVDQDAMSVWFERLREQTMLDVKPQRPINWKSYYLDQPIKLQWTLTSGESKSLLVGYKSNFDGRHFVRKADSLFLGTSFLGDALVSKTSESLRSKKIINVFDHPNEIIFKNKKTLVLNWSNDKWELKGRKDFPLDFSRLDGFWTDLKALKALKIVAPSTVANLKKYGLYHTPHEIILKFSNGEVLKLKISSLKSPQVLIVNSSRDYILEISKTRAKRLVLNVKDIINPSAKK